MHYMCFCYKTNQMEWIDQKVGGTDVRGYHGLYQTRGPRPLDMEFPVGGQASAGLRVRPLTFMLQGHGILLRRGRPWQIPKL